MMKIAIVDNEFPRASKEFISKQASELLDRGHEVQVYSHKEPPSINRVDISENIRQRTTYFPVPCKKTKRIRNGVNKFIHLFQNNPSLSMSVTNPFRFKRDAVTLRPLYYAFELSGEDLDVIHAHWGQYGRFISILKQSGLDTKIVTTFHGSDVREARENPGKYEHLFTHGDFFIANSKYTYNELSELNVDNQKLIHLPNPFDPSQIPYKDYDGGTTTRGGVKIITVANLNPIKGIDYAIKAIAKVLDNCNSNIEYHIVGSGTEREQLEELASDLGISDSVILHGHLHRKEVFNKLSKSDLFLLPSLDEGFGMVILEAQAAGLPVIATETGGIPEAINSGSENELVQPKDATAITSSIRQLLQKKERWPKIGEQNRNYVENKYSVDSHINRLEKIYCDI